MLLAGHLNCVYQGDSFHRLAFVYQSIFIQPLHIKFIMLSKLLVSETVLDSK